MNARKWRTASLAALIGTVTVVSACSKEESQSSSSSSPSASASASASAPAAPVASNGPLTKYTPEITLTTVRSANAGLKFQNGDSLDSNIWVKSFKQDLGINVVNKWTVSDQQYKNKMTVSMVSGDLPDFFQVDDQQLQLLVQANQIMDLTELYNKYATDLTKQSFGNDLKSVRMKAATYNNKLMALPNGGGAHDDLGMIWIRKDWLDALNLQPPKTMDDVINIAKAFANDDPDKNGKKDTFGLSVDYNLFNGWSGLDGFFNGYGAYPYNPSKGSGTKLIFLKGADGKPIYADIQPEVKTALGKLQELFKAGAINPEFSVIDGNKSAELATQGKVGMSFGQWFVGTWPINNMKKADPKVEWQAYPLVSADGKPVKSQSTGAMPLKYYVINKNAKNPEAVFKLLNYFNEKVYSKTPDETYHQVVKDGTTYSVFAYAPIVSTPTEVNQQDYYDIQDALKSNDTGKLTPAAKGYYDAIQKYKAGDFGNFNWWSTFGPTGAFGILGQFKKGNQIVESSFTGTPTETMISKGPTLRDLEAKTFTKIIMGDSLDTFDEFVKQWKQQGGDQIIKEVAESGMFN